MVFRASSAHPPSRQRAPYEVPADTGISNVALSMLSVTVQGAPPHSRAVESSQSWQPMRRLAVSEGAQLAPLAAKPMPVVGAGDRKKYPALRTDQVDVPVQSSSKVPYERTALSPADPPQKNAWSAESPLTSPDAHSPTLIAVAGPPTMPLCDMVIPAQPTHRMPTAVAGVGLYMSVPAPYATTCVSEGDAPSMKMPIPVPPTGATARYSPPSMVGDAGETPVWRMRSAYKVGGVCDVPITLLVTVRFSSVGDASVTVSAEETSENGSPNPAKTSKPSRLVAAVTPGGTFTPSGGRPA